MMITHLLSSEVLKLNVRIVTSAWETTLNVYISSDIGIEQQKTLDSIKMSSVIYKNEAERRVMCQIKLFLSVQHMTGETGGGGRPGGTFPSGPHKFHFLSRTRGTQI